MFALSANLFSPRCVPFNVIVVCKAEESWHYILLYSLKMMSSTLIIFVSVTTLAILSGEALAALPVQCNPGYLEELPPRLRKICIAIARIWDVRDMNDFVDDRGIIAYRLNRSFYISRGEQLFNL